MPNSDLTLGFLNHLRIEVQTGLVTVFQSMQQFLVHMKLNHALQIQFGFCKTATCLILKRVKKGRYTQLLRNSTKESQSPIKLSCCILPIAVLGKSPHSLYILRGGSTSCDSIS